MVTSNRNLMPAERSRIQGLWVRGSLPPMQELSIRSFLVNGHSYDLYSYDAVPNVPEGARLLSAYEILPIGDLVYMRPGTLHEYSVAPFSNLFRYKLLHLRGGWWADLDVICLQPFDFTAEWVFATERTEDEKLLSATCVMRAPAGSTFFAECYERARTHPLIDTVWASTGPALVDSMLTEYDLTRWMVGPEIFCPVDWWNAERLLNPGEIPEGSLAVHLWNEFWRLGNWSKEPIYESDVLYQRLFHRYQPGAVPHSEINAASLQDQQTGEAQ